MCLNKLRFTDHRFPKKLLKFAATAVKRFFVPIWVTQKALKPQNMVGDAPFLLKSMKLLRNITFYQDYMYLI